MVLVVLGYVRQVFWVKIERFSLTRRFFITVKENLEFVGFKIKLFIKIDHLLLVLFCPSILQAHGLVEYRMLCCRVGIGHEITYALELQILSRLLVGCIFLYVAIGAYAQRVWIEQLVEVALVGRGVLYKEEAVVLSYLCLDAVIGANPVECGWHLPIRSC